MTFPGLKTVAKKSLFLTCLCLLGLNAFFCQAGEGITPDRNISVVVSEPTAPEWKNLWDKARNQVRSGAYAEAAELYATLCKLKPNIEEASWEYSKVLLKIEDYTAVRKIISGLLEKSPDNSEYLLAGGQIAAHDKDWTLAAKYYGKALEKDPAGEFAEDALVGLANSLKAQGRKEAAFSLLEKILTRSPNQANLLQEGALTAQSLGYADKARKLYSRLLAIQEVDDKILFSAANAFDSPGHEQQSSALWAEYLERHPEYSPFRRKLADHYLATENFEAAIPHITYLAEQLADNDSFLLQAGKINLQQLKRPDKALKFYEKYSEKHPGDRAIKQQIDDIQTTLARDFLSIVENDGAWLLWEDLALVTANRSAIYLKMADLLEQNGRVRPFIEVLTIIHHHSPEDDTLLLRIADQYFRIGQYRLALSYLEKAGRPEGKTKSYYSLRGNIETVLGMEMAALASFEGALRVDPGDSDLRKTCLELAGKIGLAGRMKTLFEQGLKHDRGRPDRELALLYLDQLSRNFLFRQYDEMADRFTAMFGTDTDLSARMELMQATAFRREGKNRKAEQLLRGMLVEGRSVKQVLFALTDNAIADRNIEAATTWYKTLVQLSALEESEFSHDEDGIQRLLRKVRILKIAGEYETARNLITAYENERQQKRGSSNRLAHFAKPLAIELLWLNYYLGNYKGTLKMAESQYESIGFDPELYVLNRILLRKLKLTAAVGKELETKLMVNETPALTRILDVIDSELVYEQYELVEKHLQTVLKKCPESVIGNILSIRFLLAKGRFDEAVEPLKQMIDTFPDETYFTKKLVEMEVKQGRYGRGIELLGKKEGGVSDLDTRMSQISTSQDTEEILTIARLLWGDKQHERALRLYQQLLSPSVLEIVSETFRKKQIAYPTRDKSFWESMMLLLQSDPERQLAELMEPEFLVDNLTNDVGRIVASHYEMYSWQKLIANEYLARKAVFERNYPSAEQSYKRLLSEEKTAEGMIDLAAVYGRVGKYRKEAQVYEAIQNTGATSPELVNSMERSSIQMSPQNIFDVGFEEKNGRNGLIDMAKLSVGTSFWFTPDLDKDVRFVYANNRYESVDSSESAGSNSLNGSAMYDFAKDYELIFSGGMEKFDGSSNARFLYKAMVKGQLDQYFNAYLEWQKSNVYDTVMAIKEDISRQGIETGITCETPLGLTFGGDFRHLNYSDGNLQNRFHGFSSYGLYGEAIHLSLRYDYQYMNNTDANPADLETTMGIEPGDNTFYWSPEQFSEHLLTLHFQHDFLGYQQGEKRGVSYYSIDNALGSETDEVVSYTGKFNIFLEMNPHFLLKGNFTFTKSEDLEEKGLSVALHYRW
jgi:tetratricopeptide (TPR) repeat protein